MIQCQNHFSTCVNSIKTLHRELCFANVVFICKNNALVRTHTMVLNESVCKLIYILSHRVPDSVVYFSIPDVSDTTLNSLLVLLVDGTVGFETFEQVEEVSDLAQLLGIDLRKLKIDLYSGRENITQRLPGYERRRVGRRVSRSNGELRTSTVNPHQNTQRNDDDSDGAACRSTQSSWSSSDGEDTPGRRESIPSAPVPSAPVPSAPVSSAPVSSTPVPSAPVSSAPVPSAPVQSAPVPSAPVQSAPVPSAPIGLVKVKFLNVRPKFTTQDLLNLRCRDDGYERRRVVRRVSRSNGELRTSTVNPHQTTQRNDDDSGNKRRRVGPRVSRPNGDLRTSTVNPHQNTQRNVDDSGYERRRVGRGYEKRLVGRRVSRPNNELRVSTVNPHQNTQRNVDDSGYERRRVGRGYERRLVGRRVSRPNNELRTSTVNPHQNTQGNVDDSDTSRSSRSSWSSSDDEDTVRETISVSRMPTSIRRIIPYPKFVRPHIVNRENRSGDGECSQSNRNIIPTATTTSPQQEERNSLNCSNRDENITENTRDSVRDQQDDHSVDRSDNEVCDVVMTSESDNDEDSNNEDGNKGNEGVGDKDNDEAGNEDNDEVDNEDNEADNNKEDEVIYVGRDRQEACDERVSSVNAGGHAVNDNTSSTVTEVQRHESLNIEEQDNEDNDLLIGSVEQLNESTSSDSNHSESRDRQEIVIEQCEDVPASVEEEPSFINVGERLGPSQDPSVSAESQSVLLQYPTAEEVDSDSAEASTMMAESSATITEEMSDDSGVEGQDDSDDDDDDDDDDDVTCIEPVCRVIDLDSESNEDEPSNMAENIVSAVEEEQIPRSSNIPQEPSNDAPISYNDSISHPSSGFVERRIDYAQGNVNLGVMRIFSRSLRAVNNQSVSSDPRPTQGTAGVNIPPNSLQFRRSHLNGEETIRLYPPPPLSLPTYTDVNRQETARDIQTVSQTMPTPHQATSTTVIHVNDRDAVTVIAIPNNHTVFPTNNVHVSRGNCRLDPVSELANLSGVYRRECFNSSSATGPTASAGVNSGASSRSLLTTGIEMNRQGIVAQTAESSRIHNNQTTGSARSHNDQTAGSARIHNDQITGSARIHNDQTTGSARIHNDQITGSARIHNDQTTGSARIHNDQITGSARIHNDQTTGSARIHNDQTTGSARIHNDQITRSVGIHNDQTTGFSRILHNQAAGSSRFFHNDTTGSSTIPNNQTTGSAGILHNQASESSRIQSDPTIVTSDTRSNTNTVARDVVIVSSGEDEVEVINVCDRSTSTEITNNARRRRRRRNRQSRTRSDHVPLGSEESVPSVSLTSSTEASSRPRTARNRDTDNDQNIPRNKSARMSVQPSTGTTSESQGLQDECSSSGSNTSSSRKAKRKSSADNDNGDTHRFRMSRECNQLSPTSSHHGGSSLLSEASPPERIGTVTRSRRALVNDDEEGIVTTRITRSRSMQPTLSTSAATKRKSGNEKKRPNRCKRNNGDTGAGSAIPQKKKK